MRTALPFIVLIGCWHPCCGAVVPTGAIVEIYCQKANLKQEVGTGFFIDAAGHVATAYHVLADAKAIDLYSDTNLHYRSARVFAADPVSDLIILSVGTGSANYIPLRDEVPTRLEEFTVEGNPFAIKFQSMIAHATQDGFLDSSVLLDRQGGPIFERGSIKLLPLGFIVYGGLSGAPVLNKDGAAVGLLLGSFNDGGSIAWALPAGFIQSIAAKGAEASSKDVSQYDWQSTNAATHMKSFQVPRKVTASETIGWLNDKWSTMGKTKIVVDSFDWHIQSVDLKFESENSTLIVEAVYSKFGEKFREQQKLQLEDAESARMYESSENQERGYGVQVECPRERTCVRVIKERFHSGSWSAVSDQPRNSSQFALWQFRDEDSAARVATAVRHLIHLFGGPVEKRDLFNRE